MKVAKKKKVVVPERERRFVGSLEDYEIAAIHNELKQMFDNAELVLQGPSGYFERFGQWERLRYAIDEIADNYADICKERDQEQEDRKTAECDLQGVRRGIESAIDTLIDMDDDADKLTVEQTLVGVIKDLQKLL